METVGFLFSLAQSLLVTWGLKVVGAILVLIVGRILAGSLRKSLNRFMERTETDPTLAKFLSTLAYYLILAVQTIKQVLDEEPRILKDPEYQVAVAELADSSVNLVVRPWCAVDDYWGVRFDVTRALKERLEAAGCSIPYPQQDVYMHTVEA